MLVNPYRVKFNWLFLVSKGLWANLSLDNLAGEENPSARNGKVIWKWREKESSKFDPFWQLFLQNKNLYNYKFSLYLQKPEPTLKSWPELTPINKNFSTMLYLIFVRIHFEHCIHLKKRWIFLSSWLHLAKCWIVHQLLKTVEFPSKSFESSILRELLFFYSTR